MTRRQAPVLGVDNRHQAKRPPQDTPVLRFVVDFVNRVVAHAASAVTATAAADAGSTTTRPAQAVRPRLNLGLRQRRHLHQRRRFVLHARVFQHVGVLAARAGVAVFEVLPEMVGSEEFLGLVAFAELVHRGQVLEATAPIGRRRIGEFLAAVTAHVHARRRRRGRGVKGGFVVGEVGTRPGVAAEVEAVLVPLGFVFVLEPVLAVLTRIWFTQSVDSGNVTLESRDCNVNTR